MHARYVATAGMIAALYTLLSIVFLPISFGVYQIRIAEALTVLPFLTPAAIPGLYVGCVLANLIGGMGWLDILVGPLITLVAAMVTRWFALSLGGQSRLAVALAPLPPVLFNAIGVSAYLAPLIGVSFWFAAQMIAIGQIGACYVLGVPLLLLLRRRKSLF